MMNLKDKIKLRLCEEINFDKDSLDSMESVIDEMITDITRSELRKKFTEETNIIVRKPYSIDDYTKDYTEWLEAKLVKKDNQDI